MDRCEQDKGFIKLHRSILESGLWNVEEGYTIREAFIYLLLKANFKDVKKLYNGRWQAFKKGQLSTSIEKLAVEWKRDRKTVKKYLDLLVEGEMIKVESNKSGTKITVLNYSKYQDEKRKMDNSMDNGMDNSMDNSMDTKEERERMIKNEKNDKRMKKKREYIHPHMGTGENVKITQEEFTKLKADYPKHYEQYIEFLSLYIGSNGDKYKSHYMTILNWIRRDGVTSHKSDEEMAKKYGYTII